MTQQPVASTPRSITDRWAADEAYYADHPLILDAPPDRVAERERMDAELAAAGLPPLAPIED